MEKDIIIKRLTECLTCRLNITLILLETPFYRKIIFNEILEKESLKEANKEWKKASFDEKLLWVKNLMYIKFSEQDIITHLTKAVIRLSLSKQYKEIFEGILLEIKEDGKE